MRPAVLIADDDVPLLSLLRAIVSRNGDFEIVTCRDGEEAINALASRHFDVVLLDLMMPRRNGFDVLEFLRAHRPAQLRVVLVLTAASDPVAERLDGSVVHGVVSKPFDTGEMIELIRTILDAASELAP
jgi:DNA-binding response OmpR family regulator